MKANEESSASSGIIQPSATGPLLDIPPSAPSPSTTLRDIDIPSGRRFSKNHPKRVQLAKLIRRNAPEYHLAPDNEGFESAQHGRFIRSKGDIITSIINDLLKEGGRYMISTKNGEWLMNTDYHNDSQKMRKVIGAAFQKEIRSWGGNVPPLSSKEGITASCKFPVDTTNNTSQSSSRFPADSDGRQANNVLHEDLRNLDNDGAVPQHLRGTDRASLGEVEEKRSRSSSSPSNQPPQQRRRLLTGAVGLLSPRSSRSQDSFISKIGNVLGSISLAEQSSISSLSRSKPTTVSDHERKPSRGGVKRKASQKVLQVLKLVPQDPPAKVSEPFKSNSGGFDQIPVPVIDMEITLADRAEDSTLGTGFGYGNLGGKSVKRLVSDLKKRILTATAIKQRLDELTHRAISEDKALASEESVRDVVEVVSKAMENKLSDVNVQLKAFSLISQLYDNMGSNDAPKPLIAQALRAMHRHGKSAVVQCEACQLLGRLSLANTENQRMIMSAQGIDEIAEALLTHFAHKGIQQWGCYVLRQLSDVNPQNDQTIADGKDGIALILQTMLRHEQHAKVQEWGCFALGHCAFENSKNQQLIAEANNGIDVILQAMRSHHKQTGVQEWGCFALGRLAFGRAKNQRAIADANGIGQVLQAMRQHSTYAGVQQWGCFVLGHLAFGDSKNQHMIAEANNGLDTILRAMRQHQQHTGVQEWGCVALGRLAFESPKHQDMITDANGVDLILHALRHHEQHAGVQEWGCFALGRVAYENPEKQCMIAESRGIDVILQAMRHHQQNGDVQRRGCVALGGLGLYNPKNKRLIADANGIDVILRAMQQHPRHWKVQETGCVALAVVARNVEANQRAMAKSNGADAIRHAVQRYPEEHIVQKYGGMVLKWLQGLE